MDVIKGRLSEVEKIGGSLSSAQTIKATIKIPTVIYPATYHGEHEITPSREAQTLETEGLYMTENITVNPIPSNYGLITWNGSTITVS